MLDEVIHLYVNMKKNREINITLDKFIERFCDLTSINACAINWTYIAGAMNTLDEIDFNYAIMLLAKGPSMSPETFKSILSRNYDKLSYHNYKRINPHYTKSIPKLVERFEPIKSKPEQNAELENKTNLLAVDMNALREIVRSIIEKELPKFFHDTQPQYDNSDVDPKFPAETKANLVSQEILSDSDEVPSKKKQTRKLPDWDDDPKAPANNLAYTFKKSVPKPPTIDDEPESP